MLTLIIGIFIRIFSNSYLNVFQKILTNNSEKPSVINFYTYLGLSLIGSIFSETITFSTEIIYNILIMGFLGALGNYFIIKALSCGELSSLAPINSYKPVVALIFGIFLLNEIPNLIEISAILLIIIGTIILANSKFLFSKACFYRILALIFSGTEAIFIKKIILLTNISTCFLFWAISGLVFSTLFILSSKHKLKIIKPNIKYQLGLIILVGLMQYSTNFVFSKINVAYALSLFQLSTIVSVFLGVNIFKEKNLIRKIIASIIMIFGAIILILS